MCAVTDRCVDAPRPPPRGRGGHEPVCRRGASRERDPAPDDMSPALYVSVSLATCVGLCRFGEAWAALGAEHLLTYDPAPDHV